MIDVCTCRQAGDSMKTRERKAATEGKKRQRGKLVKTESSEPTSEGDGSNPVFLDPQGSELSAGGSQQEAPKRKRGNYQRRSKPNIPDEEDVFIDEDGREFKIPARHDAPISHSRPKRRNIDEPTMMIKVNPKAIIGASEFADLPAAPVHVPETCTVQDLQEAIYASCSFLPPKVQQVFYKDSNGALAQMDPESAWTLKDLGFGLPGPHEVWLHCNFQEAYAATSAVMDPAALPANSPVSEMPSNPPDQSLAMVLADPGQPGSGMADPMQQASGQMDPHQAMVAASMAGIVGIPMGVPAGEIPAQGSQGPSPSAAPTHHRNYPGGARNRRNKRWSDEEIEHLLLGLMKYGLSSWTTICQRWTFEDRTTVDLKDKWRNLVKNVRDGRQMRGMALTEEAKNRIWRIMRENGVPLESQAKPSTTVHPIQMSTLQPMLEQPPADQPTPAQQHAMQYGVEQPHDLQALAEQQDPSPGPAEQQDPNPIMAEQQAPNPATAEQPEPAA